MSQHIFSLKTNFVVFGILMFLMFLTVGAAYMDLGWVDTPIALAIAFGKMIIIMLYFMHLRYSTNLTMIFAGAGFLWLILLASFTLADILSRDWLRTPNISGSEYFTESFVPEGRVPISN